jgi:polyferredoxin
MSRLYLIPAAATLGMVVAEPAYGLALIGWLAIYVVVCLVVERFMRRHSDREGLG